MKKKQIEGQTIAVMVGWFEVILGIKKITFKFMWNN